ncbi:MAG: helix-turn-helix domain-containing protein [Gammaproteobacteria bacterium]|nr:helix-turn-helix domain-containing protein [Gammaproteobacteria bacterium]
MPECESPACYYYSSKIPDDSFFLPTRDDMGAMLGITTESASKATAEFRRNGWLKPLEHNRAWIDSEELMKHFD